MYKVIMIQTRPDVNIPFYSEFFKTPAHILDYLKNNHPSTFISSSSDLSIDKFTLTTTTIWSSRKNLLKLMTDLYWYENYNQPKFTYDLENNIKTISMKTETIC